MTRPLHIAVLLRRLLDRPGHVADGDVLGPCERAALAAALRLAGAGDSITAISVGPAVREDRVLAVALRAGCDRAVRVFDNDLEDLDYLGTAHVLAAAARHVEADLVLCGDRSGDEGVGAIGPAVADELSLPHLSGVVAVERDTNGNGREDAAAEVPSRPDADGAAAWLVAERRCAGAVHRFDVTGPAVLGVRACPAPDRDRRADGGVIEELDLDDLEVDSALLATRVGLFGNPRPLRPGPNATIAQSAAELVARLVDGRLLG